jgi:lipopolysaccharide transport system ATP-binding protein
MDTSPVLSCAHVSKTFRRMVVPSTMLQDRLLHARRHREMRVIRALDDANLEARAGEWIGLYGHNGCGKTTLLRILAGLMLPDAGMVAHRGRLACFFELGAGFHLEHRADENIYFHGILHGLDAAVVRKRIPEIIEFAGVGTHADLPLKCYSTGMRTRLAFAVVAHVRSDIYLWDEVAAVGDAEFQEKCMRYLRGLRASGKTAVIVSHDRQQLEKLCHRVIDMDHGRMTGESILAPLELPSADQRTAEELLPGAAMRREPIVMA